MTKSDEEREEKRDDMRKSSWQLVARDEGDAEEGDTVWQQLGELWVAGSLVQGRQVQAGG